MASKPAGQSTWEMANKRRKMGITVLLIALIVMIVLTFLISNARSLGIGGIGILVLLVAVRIIFDWTSVYDKRSTRAEKRAVRGAIAEEAVGDLLASLDDSFMVLHDIESPSGNIDHIVLSEKNGLFLIETKAHGGRVQVEGEKLLVNGKPPEKDFIAQTLKNTYWLKREVRQRLDLDIWITPILVFTNAYVPIGKPIKGISIINNRYLKEAISRPRKENPANHKLWEARTALNERLK